MKKTIFTGAGVAIITPMNPDGSVNYGKLAELIEFQIENKTDAIIICGTTGESATLSHEEHTAAIKFAVDTVNKRVPVIAGTGSNDTEYALELSKQAEKDGADALLLVTPYYNKCSAKGLIEHFSYVANNVNLPIILYNVPSRTGVNITPEICEALCEVDNIVAIKEASGSISQAAKIRELCGEKLDIYSGNDDMIVPLLSIGAKGVISVLSNVMPRETHNMCELYFNKETDKAAELQIGLLDLINNLFIETNPIPVKTAMNLMGYNVGPMRRPLCDMEEGNLEKLKASLKKHGLI